MIGFFLITRGITKHPLFKGKPDRLAVWLWLLDNVAWKDTMHDVKGHTVSVPRGSVCASERTIADECGVGYQVVRTAIKRFKSEQMINAQPTHGKNIITLCNYEKHQNPEKTTNATGNATPTQPQRNPNAQKKQGNKVTIEDSYESLAKKPSKKRGSRLSENWTLPMDWGQWASEQGFSDSVIRLEADKFKDYWISKAGSQATKVDWRATWRNWIRNCKSPKVLNGGQNGKPTAPNTTLDAIAIAARMRRSSGAAGH